MQRLPVHLQDPRASVFELHALSIRHQLTSYDALYLEVALATGLPLATRDKALRQAATESGVGAERCDRMYRFSGWWPAKKSMHNPS